LRFAETIDETGDDNSVRKDHQSEAETGDEMSSILFEQASIKGIQLKNRFVRSATIEGMATSDGHPTEMLYDFYDTLAQGGVGLIVTGGACIEAWKNLPDTIGLRSPWAMYYDDYRCLAESG
jgi:hypothetical protein